MSRRSVMSVEKLRPLHDRILVKRLEEGSKTEGGLYIPDNAKERGQWGQVIKVGQGRWVGEKLRPLEFKEGDKVFFGKYAGTQVGSDDYLILKEDEILGISER